jgi:hypothetical protein
MKKLYAAIRTRGQHYPEFGLYDLIKKDGEVERIKMVFGPFQDSWFNGEVISGLSKLYDLCDGPLRLKFDLSEFPDTEISGFQVTRYSPFSDGKRRSLEKEIERHLAGRNRGRSFY